MRLNMRGMGVSYVKSFYILRISGRSIRIELSLLRSPFTRKSLFSYTAGR